MPDPRELKALLAERARRQANATKYPDLLASSFPEQAAFVRDPSKLKAALCTRRAGKSYGSAIMMVTAAIEHPGSRIVYLTISRQKARENMQKPISDTLRRCGIKATWKQAALTFSLENGSEIILRGLNKEEDIEKLRGDHYPLVILDECGHSSFNKRLDYIVSDVIEPAVAQHDGTIVLIGTPGLYTQNLFYEVTGPKPKPGWTVHRWTWEQNTTHETGKDGNPIRICDAVARLIARKIRDNPAIVETDGYRREWRAEWVMDPASLYYRFIPERNLIPDAPKPDGYTFILGCDLGYNDATGFVVLGYHKHNTNPVIFESYKETQTDITRVAQFAKKLDQRYRFRRWVIDGASKQAVEEMRNRHRIPWEATPKGPNYKWDATRLMNDDFVQGIIKIVAKTNKEYVKELTELTISDNDPTRENPRCENHLCDAALYAWRLSLHFRATPEPEQTEPEPAETYKFFNEEPQTEALIDWVDRY